MTGVERMIPSTGRGRLLVIEDDAMQQLLVGSVARAAGYVADGATSIPEALSLMAERTYAAVVVDLSLGAEDGVEAIRHVASTGQRPAILIISGFETRIRDAAIRFSQTLGLPSLGDLEKPLDVARLRACLSAELPALPQTVAPPACPTLITRDELAHAIASGEIQAHYQPKISLTTGRIVGTEALARWTSPVHGPVTPCVFVPLADENGLGGDLTFRILDQAVRDAAAWCQLHPGVGVAVNVPAGALLDLAFPERIEQALQEACLPAGLLTLEVTESVALSDDSAVGDVLTRLRIKGVQLSLDDFGTGYSSLASLLRIPFCELKIDRSFVQAADTDAYAGKIVRATVSLAREFGMRTVAEGVSSESVAALLRQMQCDTAQGWLFARAEPFSALVQRLSSEGRGSVETGPHFRRH